MTYIKATWKDPRLIYDNPLEPGRPCIVVGFVDRFAVVVFEPVADAPFERVEIEGLRVDQDAAGVFA